MSARRVISDSAADGRDGGTILILTLGFLLIAMSLAFAVVDASAVFLDRRDLAAAADGAALAAVQDIDVAAVYAHGAHGDLPLDAAGVDRAVRRFATANYPADRFPGWHFAGEVSGPDTVVVHATRVVHLPVYGTVTVTADASATNRTAD
ncbi:MAG: pilus assembly protein TadG-related protein [Mycobacteriales bacterium]